MFKRLVFSSFVCAGILAIPYGNCLGDVHEDVWECKEEMLGLYEPMITKVDDSSAMETNVELEKIPDEFAPWWQQKISSSVDGSDGIINSIRLVELVETAIQESSQVRTFRDIPAIRETSIDEAKGRFSTHLFAEGRYSDVDEPVGSLLQSSENERFREYSRILEVGLRKTFSTGGRLELSQELTWMDSNSEYFEPEDQAHARFKVGLHQPLLNGVGFGYNRATIELAELDSSIGMDEFRRQVESHSVEVHRAYWGLYLERGTLLQYQRLMNHAKDIVNEMEKRKDVDSLESELAKAKAALAYRSVVVLRSLAGIENAESRIRSLVNDTNLYEQAYSELVPLTDPIRTPVELDLSKCIKTAIMNRPEINQAVKQLVASGIRLKMSKNEKLPVLNLFAEAYVHGLQGEYDMETAYDDQFDEESDHISYMVGLMFDVPLGRRKAKARYRRHSIEQRQLTQQLRTTLETLALEVTVSVREVSTSLHEMQGLYHAMKASQSELDSLEKRRSIIYDGGGNAGAYLQDLLDTQARLTHAEQEYLRSILTYNVALISVERAQGTLLDSMGMELIREEDDNGLPAYSFVPIME